MSVDAPTQLVPEGGGQRAALKQSGSQLYQEYCHLANQEIFEKNPGKLPGIFLLVIHYFCLTFWTVSVGPKIILSSVEERTVPTLLI